MIFGIGTDIVSVKRLAGALERHGDSFLDRVLSPLERIELPDLPEAKVRFLARRWAAKESFSKAYRTGIRGPVTLSSISVRHETSGAPCLEFSPELTHILQSQGLNVQVSISDEHDYAVAFVVIERTEGGALR